MRAIAALVLAFLPVLAQAQAATSDDPPTRVGRISWMSGEVVLYSDPEHGWEKAYVNSPLASENSLWTEPSARAEVRIGSTTLRLDAATQLDIRRLDDNQLRAHVVRGTVNIRIRDFDRGEQYVVSTPNTRFILTSAGRYRVDTDEERGEAMITVFSGSAEVDAGRRASVASGEAVRVYERGDGFEFERVASTPFDDWAVARDERLERGNQETTRYVSRHMTGYEDLGEYGTWSTEADYGAIWYPSRVGVDYVPYRDGRWAYVRPWGWTWVDNAPWGYAPFHYGRWVHINNRWGWHPGRYVARPVWAPALVGWVGRPGWNISISTGRAPAVGWYPLSPWDRYQPWYTNNTAYINNVNVIVNRPPRGREGDRDRNRERGATVVLREHFVAQRPVSQGLAQVSGEAVREAVRSQPVATPTQVLPTRAEVMRVRPAPTQVGGAVVGGAVVGGAVVGGGVAAPRGVSKPVFTAPAAPAAPRVQETPAPRPAVVGGEAVRPGSKPMRDPSPQLQVAPRTPQPQAASPVAQPQVAPPARTRPAQPVELQEQRTRPAPQAQPQARPQPQPQAQPQAQPAVQGEAQRSKPAPATRPAPEKDKEREDKPDKPEKPEKPGRQK